jgi:phage baseplate assembly protein W
MPIPHISFPPRIENGKIATVEQDSFDEIRDSVLACLSTKRGSRMDAPEYGIVDETFIRQSVNPSVEMYVRAVEEAEPRARLLGEAELEGMVRRVILKVSE